MFQTFILPRLKRISNAFIDAGCVFSELVIGGKTDSVARYMHMSGFDIILCDYPCDIEPFMKPEKCLPLIRRNINPILIEQGDFSGLQREIDQLKQLEKRYTNVVVGTGVLSYNAPTENILRVKQMCLEN